MKTVQFKLYKAVMLALLTIGIPAFIAGWVVAVNFSGVFETGYKMAFMDIKSAVRESVNDSQKYFYMNGIKFSTREFSDRTCPANIQVVSINAGREE
jgi:hypothetical protein